MRFTTSLRLCLTGLTTGLILSACGGGSGGGGDFQLLSISVPSGAVWELNRPIEFRFSEPVDFSTVTSNSLTIRTPQGQAALGEYALKVDDDGLVQPNTVVFQPRCPLQADFSDAGLKPNSQTYIIEAIGADNSIGLSVKSSDGDVLALSQKRQFTTASGSLPSELFIDTAVGFPLVVVRRDDEPNVEDATHIRLRESGERRYFEIQSGGGGIQVEPFSQSESDYPINLFSVPAEQFDVVVYFDQAVSPLASNISTQRLRLQARPDGASPWENVPAQVALEANCADSGARVRVRPAGLLPQEHDIRVVVSADFADIVGQQGLLAQDSFAPFRTQSFPPLFEGEAPVIVDEFFESFAVGGTDTGSNEDVTPEFAEPTANWSGGRLQAALNFNGTGGNGANDLTVGANETVIINTGGGTVTLDSGDLLSVEVLTEVAQLDLNDLTIDSGGRLLITGAKPARILVSGDADIQGEIDISGFGAGPVPQLNSPNVPAQGASGNGGGGKGGRGSPLTTTSTPKGENGFGPGDAPGGGGVGGESAYRDTDQAEQRRGAGGGGGRLANEYEYTNAAVEGTILANGREANGPGNDDNIRVNALIGVNGSLEAVGAVTGISPPQPGAFGPSRFSDLNPDGTLNDSNDFFGTRVDDQGNIILGELGSPTAGAGGGGGGDSINSSVFPATEFILTQERKGGGGGGGAGRLELLVLGNLTIGSDARILSNGGRGGEGESTGGTNQIGGGGAGGSGGHIIIQTNGQLDLSGIAVSGAGAVTSFAQIQAAGGEGALGFNDGTNESNPPARGAGGDGGGGVIQIHVNQFTFSDDGVTPGDVVRPPTFNGSVEALLNAVAAPNPKLLVPTIGSRSRARSEAVALGSVETDAVIALLGVDPANGEVLSEDVNGVERIRPGETLIQLVDGSLDAPTGGGTITIAEIDTVNRIVSLDLDAAAVTALGDTANALTFNTAGGPSYFFDDAYLRNPALLREAALWLGDLATLPGGEIDLASVASSEDYVVEMAEFVPDDATQSGTLRLFVGGTQPLPPSGAGLDLVVGPRSFRVRYGGDAGTVPDFDIFDDPNQSIQIQLQLLFDDNGTLTELTPFTADLDTLNDAAGNAEFVRFDVLFDLGEGADGNTRRPALDFLRVPFQF